MQGVEGPGEDVAARDEEGGSAVRAAAEGEDGVGEGFARVAGDDGVEARGGVLVGRGEGAERRGRGRRGVGAKGDGERGGERGGGNEEENEEGGTRRRDSFRTARRYFISLSCSKVGFLPARASTSARSFAQTSGRWEISHQTLERSEAVVSRPARRMLRSSLRTRTWLRVCLRSSCRKT